MRRIKLIYVAMPYRGKTIFHTIFNILCAWWTGYQIIKHCPGWFPIIPHMNTALMDFAQTHQYFLDGTLESMLRADAVFAGWRWGKSKGARNETCTAHVLEMPIYYSIKEIPIDELHPSTT